MNTKSVDSYFDFILLEDAPILTVSGSTVNESGKNLLEGTVVKGNLKTRIISIDGKKTPYKFIEINDKGGFISPQVVNLYVSDFVNLDGKKKQKKTPVKDTALGEKQGSKAKRKNVLINYGLPVLGGVVGYQIAKRTGADMKKTVGFVLFFGLLGLIPKYIYKK
jgi:hypothetical protein